MGLFETAKRTYLSAAKSRFAMFHHKYGRRHFPAFRHPHRSTAHTGMNASLYWSRHVTKNPTALLSRRNYITAAWTGKFYVDDSQTYTMQHATSGVRFRVRKYPIQHQYTWANRFMVGKPLTCWSKSRPDLIDEAALTKGQRAILVKKGLLT